MFSAEPPIATAPAHPDFTQDAAAGKSWLTRIEEWPPSPDRGAERPDWADQRRPLFLLAAATR